LKAGQIKSGEICLVSFVGAISALAHRYKEQKITFTPDSFTGILGE
jgi:hypothetical protein